MYFVHNSLQFDEVPSIKQLSILNILEVCGISLLGFYIICAYRPRTVKNDNFIEHFENVLMRIMKQKIDKKKLICGDMNPRALLDTAELVLII